MKVLITGITGMAGSHLADLILNNEPRTEVVGVKRWRSPLANVEHLLGKVKLVDCDLTDPFNVKALIENEAPDMIFHLAAQSFVQASWDSPVQTLNTNISSQVNLLEAIRNGQRNDPEYNPVVLVAGSSEEYGLVHPDEVPIRETNPLRPLSPYAISKVVQDTMAFQYHASYGLKTIVTRAFNHEGPRRGHVFITSNFARQVALMEAGKQEYILKVGNLDAIRDFTDVRDTVAAYWRLANSTIVEYGSAYNVCSGRGIKMSAVVETLQALSKVAFVTEEDPTRMRPSDVPRLIGNNQRLQEVISWEPSISFRQTMEDSLNYWRARV